MSIAAYIDPLARPWQGRREVARAARIAPAIMRRLEPVDPSLASWAIRSAHSTEAGIAVLMLGPPGEAPRAVLKVALTREARRSLTREGASLAALEADDRLRDWRHLMPEVLAKGELDGADYVLQRALEGRNAISLLDAAQMRRRLQTVAADTIRTLHERTAVSTVVGVACIDRWLAEPVRHVGRAAVAAQGTPGRRSLNRVTADIKACLIGRRLRVGWIHGDFWLGNVLVAGDGATATGIVDWDFAGNHELPVLDLLHLVVYTRALVERRELGGVVQRLLDGEAWTTHELSLLRSCDAELAGDAGYARATLLLYWLRHLTSNLAQSKRYLHSHVWRTRNVEPVLRLFEHPSRRGRR
jgi:aminoglycoside phosphotransferase (APT) family kinase protein